MYFSDAFDFSSLQHATAPSTRGLTQRPAIYPAFAASPPCLPLCPTVAQFCFRFAPASTVPKTRGGEIRQGEVR